MDTAEFLESVRILLKRGRAKIASGISPPSMSESLLFFGSVPSAVVRERRAAAAAGKVRGQWFLVTDQAFGREWIDSAENAGLLVAEVEKNELPPIRAELEILG